METLANLSKFIIFLIVVDFPMKMAKSISLQFRVKEHSEIGLLIGDLVENYRIQDFDLSRRENLNFQMMKENNFVSLVNGKLFVKADIDRERICTKKNQCCCLNLFVIVYNLKIQSNYFEIQISIEDINDHSPVWTQSKIVINIPEHSKIGSRYYLPLAKDLDSSPDNSISRYTLKYVNNSQLKLFSIVYNSLPDKTYLNQLLLRVDANIDREKIEKIELLLLAEDSGSPPLTGSTHLTINITDINDNSPVFLKPLTEISIKENNFIDQYLCQMFAKDLDISDNDKLTFSFGNSMNIEDRSKFYINGKNGKIFVKQILDYDQEVNTYLLPIQVTDSTKFAETILLVKVQNENDNAPVISILPHVNSSNNVLLVEENIQDETAIASLSATDMDNSSTIISCASSSGGLKLSRVLTDLSVVTKYTILLTKPLDRETNEFFQATIKCQDDGYPPQVTTKIINIQVLDKNDCTPHFPATITTVYIDEGVPVESFVTKLNASDCDVGVNSQLVYRIDHAHFSIDENTGVLRTNSIFDREKTGEYKLEATVYDRRNLVDSDPTEKVLSSTTIIRVIIKDINDCAPVFKKLFYEFSIPEGSSPRMYVGSVLAEDSDIEAINRQISYAMVIKPYETKSHISKLYFSVSPDGRIFTTKESLDRETYDMHSFSIEAWDSGPITHRVSVDVVVKIEDLNDNFPQWSHSSDLGLSINITREETVGRLVTVLKALDSDSGLNSSLNYEIIQGNEHELFKLNQKSGSLYLMKQPLSNDPEIIRLVVKVSDSGPSPLTNTTIVRIYFHSEVSKLPAESRFFEKDLVVMICMITVTLIVSGILVVAIVLLKCKHCYRNLPGITYQSKEYRHGHPDGQSSPTASDMFSSAVKLSSDVPLYHNQLYHPNRLIYEAPSGVMSFQTIRKPDSLPLYYTLKPKRSLSDGIGELPGNYMKTPFTNIYDIQQRHYALAQNFISVPPLTPENVNAHYFQHSNTVPTPTASTPMLNGSGISQANPNFESPTPLHGDIRLNNTVKWSDTVDDKRIYERITSAENAEIHCNHSLMTKDQISSFV